MNRVQVLILAACFAFLAAFFLGSGHAGEPEPAQLGPFVTGDGDAVEVRP